MNVVMIRQSLGQATSLSFGQLFLGRIRGEMNYRTGAMGNQGVINLNSISSQDLRGT